MEPFEVYRLALPLEVQDTILMTPPISVLGVFWTPLDQMTYTPPHFYPKYAVRSKVNFLVEDPFKGCMPNLTAGPC